VLAHLRAERVAVEHPQLLCLHVDRLEVVDVDRDMVVARDLALPLEEMELLVAELQPDDRLGEDRRRDALHAENHFVEPR
jgi:hypothetical protein